MPQARNPLWEAVASNYARRNEHAPQGWAARVRVFLHGDPQPIEVVEVEWHRDHSWILFNVLAKRDLHDDSGRVSPSDKLIIMNERNIARVVIDYTEKGHPPKRQLGFAVRDAEEDEPADESDERPVASQSKSS